MTARERLRLIAGTLESLARQYEELSGGCLPEDAAFLRALADRIDAEYETANDPIMGTDHGRLTRIALLNRLDAPVTPGGAR